MVIRIISEVYSKYMYSCTNCVVRITNEDGMCTSEFACFLCEFGGFLRGFVRFQRGFVRFLNRTDDQYLGESTVDLDEFRPNLTGNPVELRL